MYRHYYESVNGGEPACIDDQIPFDIPDSWEWVRLGEILSVITDGTHKTPTYVEKGIPFLSVQNISSGSFTLSPLKFISPDEHAKLSARVSPQIGDVLVCRIGTLGKAIVNTLDFEFSIFVSLGLLRPLETSLSDYLTFLINSPLGENWIDKNKVGGGTHTYKINLTSFPSMLIPLPPIREQQRISSAIEIFLEKVTKYAQIEQKLTTLDTTFSSSLKKSILQHAIQGKLVPQDPNDEPASVLLERIAEERAKLGKKAAKSMSRIERRDRGTFLISPEGNETDITEEIPFEIPETWAWAKLGEIGQWGAGATPSRSHPEYYQGDIPWLKTGDLTDGYITSIPESISDLALEKTSVKLNPEGSILMAMYGATIGKLGILTFPATTNQACCACVPFSGIFNLYVFYYLMAQRTSFIKQGEGGAQPNISKEKIVNSFIAIPPTREQERIVEALSKTFSIMQA